MAGAAPHWTEQIAIDSDPGDATSAVDLSLTINTNAREKILKKTELDVLICGRLFHTSVARSAAYEDQIQAEQATDSMGQPSEHWNAVLASTDQVP